MKVNRTKDRLRDGKLCLGLSFPVDSCELVELAGRLGFDFVTFDAEHEPIADRQIVNMIRAAEAFDVTPIVRLPKDEDRIVYFLTAGAQGIHVPRCNSCADVRMLVDSTKHYPQGKRTFYA